MKLIASLLLLAGAIAAMLSPGCALVLSDADATGTQAFDSLRLG